MRTSHVSTFETANRRLRTTQAAEYLNLSKSTLEKLRLTGGGPRYAKLGKIVIYGQSDLDAWTEARMRMSTSDPNRVS